MKGEMQGSKDKYFGLSADACLRLLYKDGQPTRVLVQPSPECLWQCASDCASGFFCPKVDGTERMQGR